MPTPRTAILFGRSLGQRDDFALEAEAAEACDVESHQVDLQQLLSGDEGVALDALPEKPHRFLYRGWMLKADEQLQLEEALEERGHTLVVSNGEYRAAHLLPEWYGELRGATADSVWTDEPDVEWAWSLRTQLGGGAAILKDHVKSAKEAWFSACFVPADCTRARFGEMCERLVEARGDRFEGGFVLRKFLPFRTWGQTPSGPAFLEFRLFFARGVLIAAAPYFDADEETPDFRVYEKLARRIDSPFFVMDVAQLEDGRFVIVELNDGGVSMLPASLDPRELINGLREQRLV